jgi:hypothetical protein
MVNKDMGSIYYLIAYIPFSSVNHLSTIAPHSSISVAEVSDCSDQAAHYHIIHLEAGGEGSPRAWYVSDYRVKKLLVELKVLTAVNIPRSSGGTLVGSLFGPEQGGIMLLRILLFFPNYTALQSTRLHPSRK